MMQEYEAALAAQRERVLEAVDCGEEADCAMCDHRRFGALAALDAYGKLARAIGAAEAARCTCSSVFSMDYNPPTIIHQSPECVHYNLAAIIRELEGA